MSLDLDWEQIYRTRVKKYPAEEVIGFVLRNFGRVPARENTKIIDLGCGQGAHMWFLAREGFDAYGIDGSPSGVKQARALLESDGLTAHFQVGDLIDLEKHYAGSQFDAVIDMGSLQHNPLIAAKRILDQAWDLLKSGGQILSMMTQTGTFGEGLGTPAGHQAWKNIQEGQLKGFGFIQLCTLEDVRTLFSRFSDVRVEEILRTLDNREHVSKRWLIEARKA